MKIIIITIKKSFKIVNNNHKNFKPKVIFISKNSTTIC